MSKLLKLRGFVSISDAQEYLSKAIGEHVSCAELYQLVLSGELVISARFHNHECASVGMFLPFNQEQHSGWLKNNQVPDEWKWVESGNIFYCETRNQHYALAPSVTSITGCWDFAMLGSEATVIDHFYRTQAANSIDGGLFDVDLKIAREDIMLIDGNCIARLQYENNSKSHLHFDYFLNKLVFRKQELNRFIQSLQEESADPLQDKRVLGSKERNTLFNLIKALCNELSIDPFSRGAATPLQEITELAGIPLSNETIRQIISRMKRQ